MVRPKNVFQFEASLPRARKRQRRAWWKSNWPIAAVVAAPFLGVGGAWLWNYAPEGKGFKSEPVVEEYAASFALCDGGDRTTCVIDGDTFWLEGTKIRIADINTPETSEPQCPEELELGERATDRLVSLLNDGGFSLQAIDRDEDAYGRKLRIVTRAGDSIGEILVDEGLAEEWNGTRRNWC